MKTLKTHIVDNLKRNRPQIRRIAPEMPSKNLQNVIQSIKFTPMAIYILFTFRLNSLRLQNKRRSLNMSSNINWAAIDHDPRFQALHKENNLFVESDGYFNHLLLHAAYWGGLLP